MLPIDKSTDIISCHHNFQDILLRIGPNYPLLLIFILSIFLNFKRVRKTMRSCLQIKNVRNLKTRKNREPFFSAVKIFEKKKMIAEEEFLRKSYGMKRMLDENFEELKALTPLRKKPRVIRRTAFYEILANQTYRSLF